MNLSPLRVDAFAAELEELDQEIGALEKRTWFDDNREFWPIHAARKLLSTAAWEPYSVAAYRRYGASAPPLSNTGAMQGELDGDVACRLLDLLANSQTTIYRFDDFTPGYMADTKRFSITSQNENNIYYEMTAPMLAEIGRFLAGFSQTIEKVCGHFWTVGSIRCFALKSGTDGGVHLDGWPRAMKKLFLLPNGVGRERGSTYFVLRTGEKLIVESAAPAWLFFENSVLPHATVVPKERPRPTIEIDLMPAMVTDPTPVYVGINGWYPLFPEMQYDRTIYRHALKRAVNLARGTVSMNFPEGAEQFALSLPSPSQPSETATVCFPAGHSLPSRLKNLAHALASGAKLGMRRP